MALLNNMIINTMNPGHGKRHALIVLNIKRAAIKLKAIAVISCGSLLAYFIRVRAEILQLVFSTIGLRWDTVAKNSSAKSELV